MSRRKAAGVAWLIVGPEPFLATCERCGVHEPKPDLPTSLDAAIAYMDYLVKKHRDCAERNPAVPA